MHSHHSSVGAIADVVFAAVALILVARLVLGMRKASGHGQRLGASLVIGAVAATGFCIWMDRARHAALASGHHPVAPLLAAGWAVITAVIGVAVFALAAWRASARARAERARAEADAVRSWPRARRSRGRIGAL
jgi:hypothetical protein